MSHRYPKSISKVLQKYSVLSVLSFLSVLSVLSIISVVSVISVSSVSSVSSVWAVSSVSYVLSVLSVSSVSSVSYVSSVLLEYHQNCCQRDEQTTNRQREYSAFQIGFHSDQSGVGHLVNYNCLYQTRCSPSRCH